MAMINIIPLNQVNKNGRQYTAANFEPFISPSKQYFGMMQEDNNDPNYDIQLEKIIIGVENLAMKNEWLVGNIRPINNRFADVQPSKIVELIEDGELVLTPIGTGNIQGSNITDYVLKGFNIHPAQACAFER